MLVKSSSKVTRMPINIAQRFGRAIFPITSVLSIFVFMPNASSSDVSQELFERCFGEVASAIESCSAILDSDIKLSPNDRVTILLARGRAYINQHEYELAIGNAAEVLDVNQSSAEAYVHQGVALLALSDAKTAISKFDQAVALSPNLIDAYYNRGLAYRKDGNCQRAILDFKQVIDLNDSGPAAHNALGTCFLELQDYTAAIDEFTTTIEIDPNSLGVLFSRSAAYSAKGEFDLAIKDLDAVIEKQPQYAPAYYNLGVIYRARNNLKFAISKFSIAIGIDSRFFEALYNRGVTYLDIGEYRLSIDDFDRVVEILSSSKTDSGSVPDVRFDSAIKGADSSRFVVGRSGYTLLACTYLERARAFHEMGEYVSAANDYDSAIQRGCDVSNARALRALAVRLQPIP